MKKGMVLKIILGDLIPGYAGSSKRDKRTQRWLCIISLANDDETIGDGIGTRQTSRS